MNEDHDADRARLLALAPGDGSAIGNIAHALLEVERTSLLVRS